MKEKKNAPLIFCLDLTAFQFGNWAGKGLGRCFDDGRVGEVTGSQRDLMEEEKNDIREQFEITPQEGA